MTLAYITHPECAQHDMGRSHPESPARLRAITDRLLETGLLDALDHHQAPQASRGQVGRVHAQRYMEEIFASAPSQGRIILDPDTSMNPHSLAAALHAAGAGVLAVDLVLGGQAGSAFCAVRPPGHHAEYDRAMGFCIFNNIAVAAAHALEAHGLERVAILDFDVHHGNGTEDIFREDERLLFCSTFQHPYYPFSGASAGAAHIHNTPLARGSGGEEIRAAVEQTWLPALREHQPQCLFISAGFDAHRDDDMAGLGLVENDYAWITRQLREAAQELCQGRIVSMLEGGYHLDALGRSVEAHLRELL